ANYGWHVITYGINYDGNIFIQAEDGIRDRNVTGVQTCALPIYVSFLHGVNRCLECIIRDRLALTKKGIPADLVFARVDVIEADKIGRASCRERVYVCVVEQGIYKR